LVGLLLDGLDGDFSPYFPIQDHVFTGPKVCESRDPGLRDGKPGKVATATDASFFYIWKAGK